MATDGKPEGYYDPIENPYGRKEEVRAMFKGFKIVEHDNGEPDYSYLGERECFVLEIVNPYGGENLFIEFEDRFTLFFGGWHEHYDFYEYDYGLMKKDAMEIVNNRYGAMCFYAGGKWCLSTLLEEKASPSSDPSELIKRANCKDDLKSYSPKIITMKVTYWRSEDSFKHKIAL